MVEANVRDKTIKASIKILEHIKELRKKIATDFDNRKSWERKLIVATNQRMGLKRYTNQPYPGAPDIPVPETDKNIRKKKPQFVLSVVGQKQPVSVDFASNVQPTPELSQLRQLSEIGFNYIVNNKVDILRSLTVAADQFLEKGSCIFKVYEEFKTEVINKTIDVSELDAGQLDTFDKLSAEDQRTLISQKFNLDEEDEYENGQISKIIEQYNSGKRVVQYDIIQISSLPKIFVPDTEDICVPSYTTDIEYAERITERFFLTERELVTRAINGTYDKSKVDKLLKDVRKSTTSPSIDNEISSQKDRNEGIDQPNESELWKTYLVSTWMPRESDGRYEKWVFTILADVTDDNDATIQVIRFPYEFEGWNYVKHDYEVRDHRYYSSRGVPEIIRGLNEFLERALNNMLIRDEINNSPIYTVLSRSRLKESSNRFRPGQYLVVGSHDEVQELGSRSSRVDLSSNLIMDKLKAFIEEYLGSTDQLFRNATNAGGGKTLGEIERGVQLAENLASLDLLLFNETLSKVYKKIWKILQTRLGDPIIVNGTVIPNEAFQFDADLVPTGSIEMMNKNNQVARAWNRVQMIVGQLQLGLIATPEDLYNVCADFLEKDGIRNPDRYITRPEVVAQQRQQQAEAQAQQAAQIDQQLAQRESQLRQQAAREGGSAA